MRCNDKKRYRTLEDAKQAAGWINIFWAKSQTAYECPHREFKLVAKSKWSKKMRKEYFKKHYHLTSQDSGAEAIVTPYTEKSAKLRRLNMLLDEISHE